MGLSAAQDDGATRTLEVVVRVRPPDVVGVFAVVPTVNASVFDRLVLIVKVPGKGVVEALVCGMVIADKNPRTDRRQRACQRGREATNGIEEAHARCMVLLSPGSVSLPPTVVELPSFKGFSPQLELLQVCRDLVEQRALRLARFRDRLGPLR